MDGVSLSLLIEKALYPGCIRCKENLKKLQRETTDSSCYGTREMEGEGPYVQGYVLRPDRNESGVITSWHLDLTK